MSFDDLLIVVPQADPGQTEEGFITGMFRSNVNGFIALLPVRVCVAIEPDLIHAFLIVEQTAFRALDLIAQPEFASHTDPARADRPDGFILKPDEELEDVFIFDRSLLSAAVSRC